jgi:hypothetical protein
MLLWIYHMHNPHSPFRDYKNKDKSGAIIDATFPKDFIDGWEKKVLALIQEAEAKNKDLDAISDTVVEGDEVKPKKKKYLEVPRVRVFDPMEDEDVVEAVAWYTTHLKQTPLWYSYESYKESMYNLSDIIRKSDSTAQSIRAASQELDTIPLKMEKMKQQAIKDEAVTLKVAGDRNIRRSEMLTTHNSKSKRKTAKEV